MTKRTREQTARLGELLVAMAAVLGSGCGLIDAAINRTSGPPRGEVSAQARAVHAGLVVADLHADSLLWGRNLLRRNTRGHVDLPRLVEGNVALQAFTIVTSTPWGRNVERNADTSDQITFLAMLQGWPPSTLSSRLDRALYQAAILVRLSERSSGELTFVRSRADLAAFLVHRRQDPQRVAAFLGVEGAQALDGELGNLDRLFAAGIRMMSLTHFTDNDFAGSASGLTKEGLTQKGEALVHAMEAKHMLVDLAHASPRTIDDVVAIATAPLVVSHTGVRGTCDNSRNLSDAQLESIAATGGLIGIGYFREAICGTDAAAIGRAIRYAADVVGVEHVALGSDFDGGTSTPFDAAGLSRLTQVLIEQGFDDREIALLMGGNVVRLLLERLP